MPIAPELDFLVRSTQRFIHLEEAELVASFA